MKSKLLALGRRGHGPYELGDYMFNWTSDTMGFPPNHYFVTIHCELMEHVIKIDTGIHNKLVRMHILLARKRETEMVLDVNTTRAMIIYKGEGCALFWKSDFKELFGRYFKKGTYYIDSFWVE